MTKPNDIKNDALVEAVAGVIERHTVGMYKNAARDVLARVVEEIDTEIANTSTEYETISVGTLKHLRKRIVGGK